MKIGSIIVFDLSKIISDSIREISQFSIEYNITVKTDLTNLLIAKVVFGMIEQYQNSKGSFVVFHLHSDLRKRMVETKNPFANYKKLLHVINKIVDFPKFETDFTFNETLKMIKVGSPLYDEIISGHKSFAEVLPALYNIVKKLKLKRIDKEILSNQPILYKFLTTI